MVTQKDLLHCKHWVFDMDGTLTLAQHDFDAIRAELGLPEGLPILESLAALPAAESVPLHQRLDEIELEIAAQSQAAEGAAELLDYLQAKQADFGILTRNNKPNIKVTLQAAGLYDYFDEGALLSRDCVTPKPAGDGICQLLLQWQGSAENTVMVGDHQHDLLAGKAAGVTTLYVDPSAEFIYKNDADICIKSLLNLI